MTTTAPLPARPAGRRHAAGPLMAEPAPATPLTWLLRAVEEVPDEPALRWRDGDAWPTRRWRDVADEVARAAGGLRGLGVGPGDRVLLLLRNRPEFHVVDLAALALGATPVSVYSSSSSEQLAYLAAHCRARVAVVEPDLAGRLLEVRDRLPALAHVVVLGQGYDALLEAGAAAPVDLVAAEQALGLDHVLTVIYTSGTTGAPKGVVLDARNVLHQVEAIQQLWAFEPPAGERERRLSYLPMAHIAERVTMHYAWLRQQAEVTCCPELAELSAYLPATRPHVVFGPPRVWEKLKAGLEAAVAARGPEAVALFRQGLAVGARVAALRAAGEPLPAELAQQWEAVDAQFAAVRALVGLDAAQHAVTGAAPVPVEVVEFFRGLGLPFAEIYGMSENTGGMTFEPLRVRPGTVGRPLPGVEVRLADDGEVLCRGAIVTRGYLDDPERTAEALDPEGWLRTGDIGELDDDGYLRIVDRKKELIITAGGKNVSPANVEAVLKTVPLVGQACVVGDGKPYLVALLVLDPDAARAWAAQHGREGEAAALPALAEDGDLLAEVAAGVGEANARLSRVEQVKRWRVLGEEWLPDSELLTPTMKLKRRGVSAHYAAVLAELYG